MFAFHQTQSEHSNGSVFKESDYKILEKIIIFTHFMLLLFSSVLLTRANIINLNLYYSFKLDFFKYLNQNMLERKALPPHLLNIT